jgi:Xaa-Pro aminopeptidase
MARIKTPTEIKKIQKACGITDAIFLKIIQKFVFKTEIELRDYIVAEIKKRGLKPSFPPIVTSGVRAGNDIHPKPTDSKLEGFVIIDMGVVYQDYMSDMTRTVYVGKASADEKKLYHKVLQSKVQSQKLVLPDVKTAFADLKAREVLGEETKYFIHTLGHGVGTRIHEAPRIYWRRTQSYFRTNMVVTVEPGIYIPNKLGIRIEDTGVVTPKGYVTLTKSSQELLVFPKIR